MLTLPYGRGMQLGIAELPEAVPEGAAEDEAFLKSVHDLVIDVRGATVNLTIAQARCTR